MEADDSKNRPSMDPMQPSVQNGRSISAMGVPYLSMTLLFSQVARPHPRSWPRFSIVETIPWYSP